MGIIAALRELKNQIDNNPNATVIIYYSGHGGQITENEQKNYYLRPYDFNPQDKTSLLPKEEFSDLVNQIKTNKMMLIFDCCHANGVRGIGFDDDDLEHDFETLKNLDVGGGKIIIASCDTDQKSYSDLQINHGVFTSVLLEALEGRTTSDNRDFVSFNDICQYLTDHVPQRASKFGTKTCV